MKQLTNISIWLLLVFSISACRKTDFTSTNVNPNAPGTVVPANLLPVVETGLAYTQGGDLARFSSLFTQQDIGFSRQAQAYYNYVITAADTETPWSNMYTTVLGNNQKLLEKSDAGSYNRYSGISRILMAYSLQLLVDLWGDVPYSAALKGDGNAHPQYDDDKALYDTIAHLVDLGIQEMTVSNAGAVVPGSDDIIFGGSTTKWVRFAHGIKARLYIHQSKNNAAMAANALIEANMAMADNSDNAVFKFGTAQTFANPIYQFNNQRADIDYGDGTLMHQLTSLSDPRLGLMSDPTYSDVNQVGIGSYYGDINGTVEFIAYDEICFIKAEAVLRSTGNISQAEQYYRAGIQANMEKLGISATAITAYLAANGTLPLTVPAALQKVGLQEWIALYQNPEAFTTWRRIGAPALASVSGSTGIPRRLVYPTSEYTLNTSNVPQATLYTPKVFWDQ